MSRLFGLVGTAPSSMMLGGAACLGRRGSKNYDWFYKAVARMEAEADAVDSPPFPEEPLHGRPRARAFLDFKIGDEDAVRRVEVELADDVVPKTVDNFVKLCTADGGQGYKGLSVHRVARGVGMFLGDADGRGGHSALGSRHFEDENFAGRHSRPFVLTMANSGADTNTSVFCITVDKMPQLDGRNVAFGVVTSGEDTVTAISNLFHMNGEPLQAAVVEDCGVLVE